MFKNKSNQRWTVLAYNRTTGARVTGDAANITAKIALNDGTPAASNDVNPTEVEDGKYRFDLTQSETNADKLELFAESSTSDVSVIGLAEVIYPRHVFDVDAYEDPDTTQDVGDKLEDSIVRLDFQEFNGNGAITPASVAVTIYKDDLTTEIPDTTGITINSPFASNTGAVRIKIDTNNDTGKSGYWAAGSSYLAKVTTTVASPIYGESTTTKVHWFRFTLVASAVASNHSQPEFSWNLNSEDGDVLELAAWLDINGQTADIDALDSVATCVITIREFSAAIGAPLLTFSLTANIAEEYEDKRFQISYTNPASPAAILTARKEYDIEVKITVNGTLYERNFSQCAW